MVSNKKIDNKDDEFEDDSILYELLEYFVRKQDPELIRCKNDAAILSTSGTIKNALRYLNNRYSLPESISQQLSLTLPWKFAVGDNGRLLAILQENVIEIRKSKDEYSSVVGKASVPKDAFPQWRKIVWSPDASMLVLASSNGYLSFYSSLGNNIFNISPKTMSQSPDILEAGDAIASMIFSEPKKTHDEWTHEFILVTYSGLLKSYHINGTHSYIQNYEFSYGNFYRNGVNAFAYDQKHNLYFVAGNCITQHLNAPASDNGLTCWRPLNDYPHFKLSFTFEENSGHPSAFSLWNFIPKFRAPPEPVIFRISISPCSNNLVCLHTDGAISLWSVPSLRLQKKWQLIDQMDHNARNPSGIPKFKKFPPGLSEFHPMDIGWWSENAIIVARYSGSISVCSIKDLRNLLGASPEFLSGQPQISELSPGYGFLCLDCETFITIKRRKREPNSEGHISEASSESEKDDDDVEPLTIVNYTANLVQSALYSITDIEKFQPKRKKSKILQRTYRILGLKSTTPEELYSRKIDIEEYEEALALANTYNLDTDLVYQTRWRKSQFSLSDIQEHLSKVSKRSWVLNECVTRVPETLEAARELLNFGLKGANLETLLAIGDKDEGKFVADEVQDDWESLNQVDLNLRQVQRINEIIDGIDLKNLSNAQKDLIKYRRKLLDHLDKLQTYEIILEDPQRYKKIFYEDFRQLTAIENAVRFAKDGNCQGVGIMFTYHGHQLMPHWLAIINWFPETLSPSKYEKLLPECDSDEQLFLLFQRELRPKDWSEKKEFKDIVELENYDGSQVLYEADPSLSAYRNTELTQELLRKWYQTRAYQIERDSCIVDNALELIRIGKSHNISGLEPLLIELETLDDLVYKIHLEDKSLAQLEKLSDLEKVELLMSTSNERNFVNNIRNYILPFAQRKVKYLGGDLDKSLLSDYLIALSEKDLTLPSKFFESLNQFHDTEILSMIDDVVCLALECIYSCMDTGMYEKAKEIFDNIPKPQSSISYHGPPTNVEDLEKELESLKILNKYQVQTTLRFIRDNKSKPEEVKIILEEMAKSLNRITPPPDEKTWAELLNDMLEIHEMIFGCIDIEVCFEICVAVRLASRIKANIQNCANLIETKKNDQSLLKVAYRRAVDLILEASKEYFNSSKSLVDSNMELAKACLHLITDDNPMIREEFELINSLQILNEFNIKILPLQVRSSQDRLKLIENCLENREDAYKRQQRLLTLANYLRIEGNNKRMREGKVLQLIAEKSYQLGDFAVCATTCQQLIDANYHPAWRIIQKLGFCDDFQDLEFRQKTLKFSMCYGPSDVLEKTLGQMHLLEVQILNKSLERWMMEHEIDDYEDVGEDSDDEFTDAMTTPQIEVKDFVPKIIGTSSDIVKSSAQMVKQSTLGILKNVGNKNFWKTALNMNANVDSDGSIDFDEDKRHNDSLADAPSFPCFYASLHDKFRLSNTEPKYTKYSMPEIHNSKLKLCQTLLRVATLSETASYGFEVSDISHLFLQSAKHVMPEDCLLGLSYMLSLRDSNVNNVEEVFRDLPRTKLYNQIAAYYYALEYYRKTNGSTSRVLSCDPIELIRVMVEKASESEESEIQKCLLSWGRYLTSLESSEELEDGEEADVSSGSSVENSDGDNAQNEESYVDSCTKSEVTVVPGKLYENESFKVEPVTQAEIEAGWDDEWDDFSDRDEEPIVIEEINPIVSDETDKNANKDDDCILGVDSPEEERFKIFEELSKDIKTREQYSRTKKTLLHWPPFTKPEFVAVEKNPILRMIAIARTLSNLENNPHSDASLVEEYQEFFKLQTIPQELILELLRNDDNARSLQENIYLRLYTNESSLHKEAVTLINTHKIVELALPILEEIFFKDLTSLFPPHSPIYDKVLEQIFLNHDIQEVETNIRLLIEKLIHQKHLPYAVALLNQLERIPPALATFSNCLELLLKKS
ncbi:neuroblastoma-amplified sequence-like [Venturia canescens]|uniref:neuroblastoma-amplified sequence-like n=1 Tax=Venturia canescens TaxID=32260 RepID=UPI001C9BD3E4|nr:neuroblastoma-amplified sequence-like [Venturia canescens]